MKRRKAKQLERTALEIKENLPEDLTLDMSFQMPIEIPYDLAVPVERIRDITLAESEADMLTLLYPIPIEKSLFETELPPLPMEFLPSSFIERMEAERKTKVTSTMRKPTAERVMLLFFVIHCAT